MKPALTRVFWTSPKIEFSHPVPVLSSDDVSEPKPEVTPPSDLETVLAAVVAPDAIVPAAWSPICGALVRSTGAPPPVPDPP